MKLFLSIVMNLRLPIMGVVAGLVLAALAAVAQEDEPATPSLGLRTDEVGKPAGGLTLPGAELLPEPTKSIRDLLREAAALVQANEHLDALAIYDQVLERRPQNWVARSGKALIAVHMYRYEEAIDIMEGLLIEKPKDVVTMNNLAWVYASADDPTMRNGRRAVELGQKALLVSPRNYHIWSTLSEGHHISGDYEKALDSAIEAIRIAMVAGASTENLREYRHQITKNQKAIRVFSLLD